MLTDEQLTSVRRHMGVPVAGIPNSSFTMGIRAYDPELPYYQQVGLLEHRMTNLTPAEEVILTGDPLGQVQLSGLPTAGATLTVSAGATQIATYAATRADLASPEPLYAIAIGIANAINAANAPNGGPWVGAIGPHWLGNGAVAASASFTMRGIAQPAFVLGVNATNGLAAVVVTQGNPPKLSVTFQNPAQVTVTGLLPILDYLESIIANSADNAAVLKADVMTLDPNELGKRIAQYSFYRRRLSRFFGIRLNPVGRMNGGAGAIA